MRINLLLILLCFISAFSFGQNFEINGIVKNASDEALPSVNVSLQNTNYSALTDQDGKFKISGVNKGEYKLIASHLGFKTFQKTVKIQNNMAWMDNWGQIRPNALSLRSLKFQQVQQISI